MAAEISVIVIILAKYIYPEFKMIYSELSNMKEVLENCGEMILRRLIKLLSHLNENKGQFYYDKCTNYYIKFKQTLPTVTRQYEKHI